MPLDQVPEAARKAIEKDAKIERVQRIKEDGKTTEVSFYPDGKIKPEEK